MRWSTMLGVPVVALSVTAAVADEPAMVLDETGPFRCYYRFATDLVSPAQLRAEGERVIGKVGMDHIRRNTESVMRQGPAEFRVFRPSAAVLKAARKVGTLEALGTAGPPAGADWRDFVFLRMFFDPYTAPPPPADGRWAPIRVLHGSAQAVSAR